jgi:hypothetical protein
MSGIRPASPRTLIVVNIKSREIVSTRVEDMNNGLMAARITKPIYDLVKSGDGIMYYAHTPHILRIPVEINGRYFAKPPKPPQVKKYYPVSYEFYDGTVYVEYDGNILTSVDNHGNRSGCNWSMGMFKRFIRKGYIAEKT